MTRCHSGVGDDLQAKAIVAEVNRKRLTLYARTNAGASHIKLRPFALTIPRNGGECRRRESTARRLGGVRSGGSKQRKNGLSKARNLSFEKV